MVDLVRDRPVSLQRFNDGIAKKGFFQKNVERGAPDWVKRVQVGKRDESLWHVLANDPATLVWLANQNCITPHVGSRGRTASSARTARSSTSTRSPRTTSHSCAAPRASWATSCARPASSPSR